MARPKKKTSTPKVKQLVRIRFKRLANGEQSIYLDLYQQGKRAYEFLKDDEGKSLRLLPETGTPDEVKAVKARNHKVLLQAESIRVTREKEVIELGKVENNVTSLGKMLLKDWFIHYDNLISISVGTAKRKQIPTLVHHLKNWLGDKFETVQMQQLTTDFFRDFLKHLHNYTRQSKTNPDVVFTLSDNSLYQIFSTLKTSMGRAVREGIINRNPLDGMKDNGELPKHPTVQRAFLTSQEVASLIKTDCKREDVKRAFLFSCFTGLRVSDILKLTWGEILNDGKDLRLQIKMQKTKDPLTMKLSSQAVNWLPDRDGAASTDKVFSTLPTLANMEIIIRTWSKSAGVEKHITFHTARHTFATLMLNNEVDIFTISKLLGHKSLETTKVYAELLNQTKDAAVDRLSEIFKGVEGV